MSKDEVIELARGARGVIVGVRRSDGSCPAREFLKGLAKGPQTQFRSQFEQLTTMGYLRNPDKIRDLEVPGTPKVWEIKTRSGYRLYVIQEGRTWVATHGRKKPPDSKVATEVNRAREIFKEWTG